MGGYTDGFAKRRLLILGESHYKKWNNEIHELNANFTRKAVEEVKLREKDPAPLWHYIEQALLNKKRVDGWVPNGADIWDQIVFYNYVQSPVYDADTAPTEKQFEDSELPFKAVIEALRPERVIVCGRSRLWPNMLPTPHDEGARQDLFLRDDLQAYCLDDGTPIWCLAINHPSRGFSWSLWHPVITAFLNQPKDALPLLAHLRPKKAVNA